jgi:hypothetical protein
MNAFAKSSDPQVTLLSMSFIDTVVVMGKDQGTRSIHTGGCDVIKIELRELKDGNAI